MKLHLGCGKRNIPGYVHVDQIYFPHVDSVSSIKLLPQYSNNSISVIYCCHALNYLSINEVKVALQEWYRLLTHKGTLRLAVPDAKILCELYLKTGNVNILKGPFLGEIDGPKEAKIFHRTIFDFSSLETLLTEAGFNDIQKYDWRKTEHAEIDDFSQAYYPHMDKEAGTLISLNVECVKY